MNYKNKMHPSIPPAEQMVYTALLLAGRGVSYAELLKRNTKLSQRDTAQHLKRLEKKGLVAIDRSQGRRYYMYKALKRSV
jgi:DNA-binding transcriptional ArsR family regulator